MTCPPSHRASHFSQTWNATRTLPKASFHFCGEKLKGKFEGHQWWNFRLRAETRDIWVQRKEARVAAMTAIHDPSSLPSSEFLLEVLSILRTTANRNATWWLRHLDRGMFWAWREGNSWKPNSLFRKVHISLHLIWRGSVGYHLFSHFFNNCLYQIYIPGTSQTLSFNPHDKPIFLF